MLVRIFLLCLVVSFGEQVDYNSYGPTQQYSGRTPRPINEDDFSAFDAAAPKITARHGSQRPQLSNPYSAASDFGRLGELSNDQVQQRITDILNQYPGAIYSRRKGRDGPVIQVKIPTAASSRNSQIYSPLPQPASPSSRRPTPVFNFKKPSPPPPSSYESDTPVVQDTPSSNYGASQDLGQNMNYSPRPQSQVDDFSQSPQPMYSSSRTPPSTYSQSFSSAQESQPQGVPSGSYNTPTTPAYQEPSQPAGNFGNNPLTSILGGGQGLMKGGPQSQPPAQEYQSAPLEQGAQGANDDVSPFGGWFGGEQKKEPPKPVATFNPTDGLQAADNLASAIYGALDYHWKTERSIAGSTQFYLDLCEKAVSNQQPTLQAMKKSDRTLMDILPVWRQATAKKLSSFFVDTARDPSYTVESKQIEAIMVIMGECVRPKLVLAKV